MPTDNIHPLIHKFRNRVEVCRQSINKATTSRLILIRLAEHAAWNEALDMVENEIGIGRK